MSQIETPSLKPWYKRIDWITTSFLLATPLATFIWMPIHLYHQGFDGGMLIFFLIFTYVCGMSITGGYHRLFSHRSYDAPTWVRIAYLIFGAGAFQGSALKWCTDHRIHHRFVDTDQDPYSIKKGFWYAHIGWLFKATDSSWRGRIPHDLANDKWMVLQDRYYGLISLAVGFGVPMLIGWSVNDIWAGLLYGGLLRVIVTHHCTFFINSLCHMWGFRPYDPHSSARDNVLLAFLTFGEGYHNFHHYFQADYRNGIRWYHWDPTKWLVGTLASVGWATRLKRTADQEILRARLDAETSELIKKGAPSERLLLLRQKIEDAQMKFREVKSEYEKLKQQAQEHSRIYLEQKRAELKAAQKDFKMARAQWSEHIRSLRPILATNA